MPSLRRGTLCGLAAAVSLPACFIDIGARISDDPATTGAATTSGETTAALSTTSGATTTTSSSSGATTTSSTDETTTGDGCVQVPWFIDADGDEHGGDVGVLACDRPRGHVDDSTDCDDDNAAVYPGADEVCDNLDNDCDGALDEWPAGKGRACNGCTASEYAGHIYYVCEQELTWDDARVACQALRGDLAIVTDKDENTFIASQLPVSILRAWIGLTDRLLEAEFVWIDRTPLATPMWANGEPNDSETNNPGSADCVAISTDVVPSGRWRDQICVVPKSSICEAAIF